jgi:hypothetical protein
MNFRKIFRSQESSKRKSTLKTAHTGIFTAILKNTWSINKEAFQ